MIAVIGKQSGCYNIIRCKKINKVGVTIMIAVIGKQSGCYNNNNCHNCKQSGCYNNNSCQVLATCREINFKTTIKLAVV